MKQNENLKSKSGGCMAGLAVGDAMGMQSEGCTAEEIKQTHGTIRKYGKAPEDRPNSSLEPGQYTDDTEQTMLLAESIVSRKKLELEHYARALVEWGNKLKKGEISNRGVGPNSLRAVEKLAHNEPWRRSGGQGTTCGSAMRVAPVAIRYYYDPVLVRSMAIMSSMPTHRSLCACSAACVVASSIAAAINMKSESYADAEILDGAVSSALHAGDAFMAYCVGKVRGLLDSEPLEAIKSLGCTFSVYDIVPFALYCFMRNPLDFDECVVTAVNAGGDSDSTACIAGAICGALNGLECIPKRWLNDLEGYDRILNLGDLLYEIAVSGARKAPNKSES